MGNSEMAFAVKVCLHCVGVQWTESERLSNGDLTTGSRNFAKMLRKFRQHRSELPDDFKASLRDGIDSGSGEVLIRKVFPALKLAGFIENAVALCEKNAQVEEMLAKPIFPAVTQTSRRIQALT